MDKKHEVLCVDDEPEVLEGLKLHLKRHYAVHLAASGADGLQVLRDHPDIAVILSDMRMPVMDGAKFLNAARTTAPESVRMLLTGYSDMESAIAAVNEGQIFRFIAKPCPPAQLLGSIRAAIQQHQLIVAERVLLQHTLLGCVESLAKVLSLTKPAAFGRALRLRAKVRSVFDYLALKGQWHIEAAAMLSQLGAVTLSEETVMKLNDGAPLDAPERSEIAASLNTSVQMLAGIPRLEPVIDILRFLSEEMNNQALTLANSAPPGALILRLVLEWDELEAQGYTRMEAFEKLASGHGHYDAELMRMLRTMPAAQKPQHSPENSSLRDLRPGMVLAEDLVRDNGVVILPRGFEIDRGLLEHILTFADDLEERAVKVFVS